MKDKPTAGLTAARRTPRMKRMAPAAPKKKSSKARPLRRAKFGVGEVVRHRIYPFRGIIFDIDPVFANSEEWWLAIPEGMRPKKDQPYYHLLAENDETEYVAYVSEQNLLPDKSGEPLRHAQISDYFAEDEGGRYRLLFVRTH